MLNSGKVKGVAKRGGIVEIRNSCEYKPWQNGAVERSWRVLNSRAREYTVRGWPEDKYDEASKYWPAEFAHATLVRDLTHVGKNGKTPYMRRTGLPGVITTLKVLFCLAYVRTPTALRTSKLRPQAEIGMNLGLSRTKPGYNIEILAGPRKGKVVTTDQLVFKQDIMPMKTGIPGTTAATVRDISTLLDELDDPLDWPTCPAPPPSPPPYFDDPGSDGPEDEDEEIVEVLSGTHDAADDEDVDADEGDISEASEDNAPTPPPVRAPSRASLRLQGATLPQTVFSEYDRAKKAGNLKGVCYTTAIDGKTAEVPTNRTSTPRHLRDIDRIEDVNQRNRWYRAHFKEADGHFNNGVIELIPLPPSVAKADLLHLRMLYKEKNDRDHTAKARLLFPKLPGGVGEYRTFSPTVKSTTFRRVMAECAQWGYDIFGMDDTQAYGQADWPADIPKLLGTVPDGYDAWIDGIYHCVRIGNLNGHPLAGRHWYCTKRRFILEYRTASGNQFEPCDQDPCLLTLRENGAVVHVLWYVDDMLLGARPGSKLRADFAQAYAKRFNVTIAGTDLDEFLSINITRNNDTGAISLDMERYITDLALEAFPGGPHGQYSVPARLELPSLVRAACKAKDTTVANTHVGTRYRFIVMAMLYVATMCRPDILYSVGMLSRCCSYPNQALLNEAERVLTYLYNTRGLKLNYVAGSTETRGDWAPVRGPVTDATTVGDSDSDHAVERSTSGHCFRRNGATIAASSKAQQSIAISSTHAEIMAGSLAACESIHLRGLDAHFAGKELTAPTPLRMDNSGAIDISIDPMHHGKAKHIERRHLHIRELVMRKIIKPIWVKSVDNVADIFTKPLPKNLFNSHRAALGLA